MTRNENYWGEPAKLDRVVNKIITEFGTRFSMLQAGEADIITVPADYRVQVDPLVGLMQVFDTAANVYGPDQNVCSVDTQQIGVARFTVCDTPSDSPLRLWIGQPGLRQDVILFTFLIQ
jgi:peptide/nickel transport system substrate-binding protein